MPASGVDTAPSMVVDHVDVTYRIYSDSHPRLRKLVAGDRRQRQYRSIEAVKQVTFVAHPGEAIGIVGHNGSGKSSLLRGMAGLIPVTGGEVYARSIPVLLGVAAALESDLSGSRNVYLGGTALGMRRDDIRDRMDEILEFAGVEDFADVPLRAYSSGMRSRLQFAIATAMTPEILMVDEALSTGDAEFKDRSDERIREMIGEAGTVLLVSHSMRSIKDVCSRVLWLDRGRLVADGDPDEVVGAYQEHMDRLIEAGHLPRKKRK
jgi:teichoic acid transport system ATP-binding protein